MTESDLPSPEQAAAVWRRAHHRRLEREGIPMILTLVDERADRPAAPATASQAEGARYARLLEFYQQVLTPAHVFPEDDEGALIAALQLLAVEHFVPDGMRP